MIILAMQSRDRVSVRISISRALFELLSMRLEINETIFSSCDLRCLCLLFQRAWGFFLLILLVLFRYPHFVRFIKRDIESSGLFHLYRVSFNHNSLDCISNKSSFDAPMPLIQKTSLKSWSQTVFPLGF